VHQGIKFYSTAAAATGDPGHFFIAIVEEEGNSFMEQRLDF